MKKLLLVLALLITPVAAAQTAVELLVASSLSASLDSAVSLPKGSFSYNNAKYAQDFSKSLGADASKYTDYQLYVASGLATKLAAAFVQQLETNFASAGYLKETSSAAGTTTRAEYVSDEGKILLLLTSYQKNTVYFLVGRKK